MNAMFRLISSSKASVISPIRQFSKETSRQLETIEKSYNRVILLGRVGNNPEQRGTEENPVVTFSMATNINYSKNEELMQITDWHRVSVFKPTLRDKIVRFMTKGSRVLVEGRISYFETKDQNNPNIAYKNASVVAEDVIFFPK